MNYIKNKWNTLIFTLLTLRSLPAWTCQIVFSNQIQLELLHGYKNKFYAKKILWTLKEKTKSKPVNILVNSFNSV